MKSEIKIPSMGESITEVKIGEILVPSGGSIQIDGELIEIETDKVNQVLYASQAGVVNWSVKSGDTANVGQVIGTIDGAEKGTETKKVEKSSPSVSPPPQEKSIRLTKETFVAELSQKGPIKESAVTQVPKPVSPLPKPTKENESRRPMSKIRQVIAKRLVESQQTTAMLTTFNEVDMSQVIFLREKFQETFTKKYGARLGYMSFFIEAVVSALKAFPNLNSYIDGNDIVQRHDYNIGVAVGTDRGVIVPVIRECDKKGFGELELAIDAFSKKAKEMTLTVDDLQNGGFTITNGGVYGSLLSTPILNPPQSGILGMHKIEKRPVVVNDQIVIRPMMYLALSYDHRLVDGKESVGFLVHIKNVLEDPSRLLLEV